jgi:phage tail sheath protein FI
MPGVAVQIATRSAPVDPTKPPSGQWFVVGQAERGPTDQAVLLSGMADFDLYFGSRVTYGYLYDQVKNFFDEGGSQCWVARVVGPGATKGTLTVTDRAGSPLQTLRFDATSHGAWSSNLTVAVTDGLLPNTFRVQLILNGVVVEDYNNLTSPSNAASRMSASKYVVVTDLGSATSAPNNNPANGSTALSAGSDDRSNINAASYVTGLTLFDSEKGIGAVSIPGIGSSVHAGIVTHCTTYDRVAILSTSQGATKSELISLSGTINSPFAALFAPWIVVSDGAGGVRSIGPESAVAAARSQAHIDGSWIVPAGRRGQLIAATDLDQTFSTDDSNDLDDARINVFRKISGTIRLYGYRSLSSDEINYKFLSVQDLLNYVAFAGRRILEDYEFDPVDSKGHLFTAINADLVGLVDPIASAGGLYGKTAADGTIIDPGYTVDTSSNVNTQTTLSNDEVHARIVLRPSPTAADIILELVRAGFTASV